MGRVKRGLVWWVEVRIEAEEDVGAGIGGVAAWLRRSQRETREA